MKTEGLQELMENNFVKREVAMAVRVEFIWTLALAPENMQTEKCATSPHSMSYTSTHLQRGSSRKLGNYFSEHGSS